MASAYTVSPNALHDHDNNPQSRDALQPSQRQANATTSLNASHLSPLLSRANSASLSPSATHFETPAGSTTTAGNYQASDFSEFEDDPFFGADFNNLDGATPSFLGGPADWDPSSHLLGATATTNANEALHNAGDGSTYPLTPEQTASLHTTSPGSELRAGLALPSSGGLPTSISPQELQKPFAAEPSVTESSQLTPSRSGSSQSSDDVPAPAPTAMHPQSPRVTVSVWDKDNNFSVHAVERALEEGSSAERGGIHSAGDLISSGSTFNPRDHRDSTGQRWPRPGARPLGLGPGNRPSDEVPSINESASRRGVEERNQEVGKWLTDSLDDVSVPREKDAAFIAAIERGDNDQSDEVPLGDNTENRYVPGQTYYDGNGGFMTEDDYDIIRRDRNWADAPILHQIQSGRHQPVSSQAAIERFERLYRDTDSIVSRAATWGTRRRSIHSTKDFDEEGVTSGNFLKKLSLNRGPDRGNKPGGLLRDLRGLVRRTSASQMLKRSRSRSRSRSAALESPVEDEDARYVKADSSPHLVPPKRTSSWGKKSTPSINTALFSMGQNAASIGTAHAHSHSRSGSVSGTPVVSPKSPRGSLSVKSSLRRPRSKSELPASTTATAGAGTQPSIIEMWKRTGGPPVASLAKPTAELEEDDDDDDDMYEDNDMKVDANVIDQVSPNFSGFQHHVLTLNPSLGTSSSNYLVDRIAHQQIIRYKQLLTLAVRHLSMGANCPCGSMCLALGGTANVLDQKGDIKGSDPISTHFEDDDGTPTEGAINQDSFPQDIPMPPTQYLPAEFECQLCYQRKKFLKPSDWTKHVHEDVQPFTCTWDKCRDPKIFKRKADWVRHENEGHRHLEWWTCDVEECRHTCYRRDNFLQHLVREHKFPEPKVKTKAALKKAGGGDPTWQKVEQCHMDTPTRPQEEPCKFCGKTFPTWKKLTVHLAKHMEQISLPVLRLVAAKAQEIDADTIISPVQDPPPRPMIPLPTNQNAPMVHYSPNPEQQMQHGAQQGVYPNQTHFMYPVLPTQQQQQFQQQYMASPYGNIGQGLQQPPPMGMDQMHQGYEQTIQDIPVTSGPYMQGPYMAVPSNSGLEPFPQLDALGLHGVAGASAGPQMGYDNIMGPSRPNGSPFSGQSSASPYMQSPHQNAGNQDSKMWDDQHQSGFM